MKSRRSGKIRVAGVRAFMGGITKMTGYWDIVDRVASCDPLFKTTPLPTLISRWHYVLVFAGVFVLVLCIRFCWCSCSAALFNFCWHSCSAALFNFLSCCAFEQSQESTHSGGSQCMRGWKHNEKDAGMSIDRKWSSAEQDGVLGLML
jgi:hypothetical protein